MDQMSSEVNELNKSLQKMESQLADAAGDVKEQFQDFLKVGSSDKNLVQNWGGGYTVHMRDHFLQHTLNMFLAICRTMYPKQVFTVAW